jgi:hypothetical protein
MHIVPLSWEQFYDPDFIGPPTHFYFRSLEATYGRFDKAVYSETMEIMHIDPSWHSDAYHAILRRLFGDIPPEGIHEDELARFKLWHGYYLSARDMLFLDGPF